MLTILSLFLGPTLGFDFYANCDNYKDPEVPVSFKNFNMYQVKRILQGFLACQEKDESIDINGPWFQNLINGYNYTALMVAASFSIPDMIPTLVAKGADVNLTGMSLGKRPS